MRVINEWLGGSIGFAISIITMILAYRIRSHVTKQSDRRQFAEQKGKIVEETKNLLQLSTEEGAVEKDHIHRLHQLVAKLLLFNIWPQRIRRQFAQMLKDIKRMLLLTNIPVLYAKYFSHQVTQAQTKPNDSAGSTEKQKKQKLPAHAVKWAKDRQAERIGEEALLMHDRFILILNTLIVILEKESSVQIS